MSAALSGLEETSFRQLAEQPGSFECWKVAVASEGFDKTFDGLRFLLSKGQSEDVIELVSQLFEPRTFVGKEVDYENINWDNLTGDEDLTGTAVYYHPPQTVKQLNSFLVTVTDEAFLAAFDPDEMNREDIYPGKVWNREVGENQGFNEQDMLDGLHLLQQFFARISQEFIYCICYVG